jgi:hypothetical protein
MVVSLLLGVLGLLEVLVPERVVNFWLDLATEGDAEARPWVCAAARLEGGLLLLWLVSRGRSASEHSTATSASGNTSPVGEEINR